MKAERDRDKLAERYYAVQVPILRKAESYLIADDIQNLRAIVRLAVEFDDYLRREDTEALDADELEYVAGSVFAGIGCFAGVSHGYKVLAGATHSAIDSSLLPALTSLGALKEKYLAMYAAFEALDVETQFEDKVCLILDLFKLQLLFVSVLFNW